MLFPSLCQLEDEDSSPKMSFITRKWLGPLRSCSNQQDERVQLFRKIHPFSLAPVTLGHLLSYRERQLKRVALEKPAVSTLDGKNISLHGAALGCQCDPSPRVSKWTSPSQPSSHQACSVPSGGVAFGCVLSKTYEHLTQALETNISPSQFFYLLRMNNSLWLPGQPGPTSESRGWEMRHWPSHTLIHQSVTQAGCVAQQQPFSTLGAHWSHMRRGLKEHWCLKFGFNLSGVQPELWEY